MASSTVMQQDFEEGKGALPQDGQQVTFDYTAYNESGSRIDSTYTKGRPAQTRLGINGLIPGEAFCVARCVFLHKHFIQCEIQQVSQSVV